MSDIAEISIQKTIKALQVFLSDEVIKYIEQTFKQFNNILKTFEDYENIVNLYDILINLVNSLETNPIIHLDEHQTQNIKHDQHPSDRYLENENIEKLIFLLSCLRGLASKVGYLKRIDFMRYILNTLNKEEILFGNVVFTEEGINKRYRKLASYLHPDKTNHLYIHITLKEEYINLCNELFKCVSELRKRLLSNLEGSSKVGRQTFHEKNAYQFWEKAIDYQNAQKAQWDKLKFYKKEDLIGIISEELGRRRILNGELAYEEYRAACKLADRNKLLKSQIELRGYMALSLYVSNRILEAQLYAFSAIKLIYQNSKYVSQDDLNKAKGIFDKVNGANPRETENIPQFKTENKPANSSDNLSRNLVKIETLDDGLSFYEKKDIFRSINDYLEKLSIEFILKADSKLVRYQANKEEILHAKCRALTYAGGGITATCSGIVGGAAVTVTNVIEIYSAAVVGAIFPPIGIALGVLTLIFGIFGGIYLWKKGIKFYEEPQIREKLNEIMKDALTAYNKGDYQKFFEELSREYKEGSSILKIKGPGDSINHEAIIKELIQHGFRSDGIAFLLILIGEVLISGKIKIPKTTPEELKREGSKAFHGVMSLKLMDKANKLDRCIKEFRTSRFKQTFNKLMGFIKVQEFSFISEENIGDSEKMTFISRLQEMHNIAKINLVIRDILDGGPDEIKRAKEDIAEIWKSTFSTQFIVMATIRLEALEDLFWIVSGYELDKPFFIKN